MKYKHFDLAKKLSKKSDHHTFRIGAVLARGNKIVGVGFNQLKTHPKSPHPYKSIHAELDAVLNSDRDLLRGAELYIYRETKYGQTALAKPCMYCESMLRAAGVERIYFTNTDGYDTTDYRD